MPTMQEENNNFGIIVGGAEEEDEEQIPIENLDDINMEDKDSDEGDNDEALSNVLGELQRDNDINQYYPQDSN